MELISTEFSDEKVRVLPKEDQLDSFVRLVKQPTLT